MRIALPALRERRLALAGKSPKRNRSELLIHGTDGRIRDKRSYGNDSFLQGG